MVKNKYRSTLTNEHFHQCLRLALTHLCRSLKNWRHKKAVTFHTDVDRTHHPLCIVQIFLVDLLPFYFFEVLIFELHRHCSGPWTDWKFCEWTF